MTISLRMNESHITDPRDVQAMLNMIDELAKRRDYRFDPNQRCMFSGIRRGVRRLTVKKLKEWCSEIGVSLETVYTPCIVKDEFSFYEYEPSHWRIRNTPTIAYKLREVMRSITICKTYGLRELSREVGVSYTTMFELGHMRNSQPRLDILLKLYELSHPNLAFDFSEFTAWLHYTVGCALINDAIDVDYSEHRAAAPSRSTRGAIVLTDAHRSVIKEAIRLRGRTYCSYPNPLKFATIINVCSPKTQKTICHEDALTLMQHFDLTPDQLPGFPRSQS